LNLKVNFELNVLQLQNMVFYDDFKSVSILFWSYLFDNVVSNLFGRGHRLHDLQVGDLLFQSVFVGW
jgi:hypothetical protein